MITINKFNKKLLVIIFIGSIIGLLLSFLGTKLNDKVMKKNNDKMPIPRELILEKLGEDFDTTVYEDNEHSVLPKKDIKKYELADIYYIKKFVFIKNNIFTVWEIL